MNLGGLAKTVGDLIIRIGSGPQITPLILPAIKPDKVKSLKEKTKK